MMKNWQVVGSKEEMVQDTMMMIMMIMIMMMMIKFMYRNEN